MEKGRKIVVSLILAAFFMLPVADIFPKSPAEKARDKRLEIIGYIRLIRPMVSNFACDPLPDCLEKATAEKKTPTRMKTYEIIKRVYQEGLVYFMEYNFINSYMRFLDTQLRLERLLEEVSQSYIDRTEKMLRDAMEEKNPGGPAEASLVDISLEYGPNSKLRRDFKRDRRAPMEARRYDPKTVHFAYNKYRIEKNMELGYYHLGLAKKIRLKALKVDANLPAHRKMEPYHRKKRIEYYLGVVKLCRLAKLNAEFIYKLKYPYDNYEMEKLPNRDLDKMITQKAIDISKVPEIENVRMDWLNNPYYFPKKLHPIFELSLPAEYRRDAADVRLMVYSDEVDTTIRFKQFKESPAKILSGPNKGTGSKKTK